jgi:hypothetical protein
VVSADCAGTAECSRPVEHMTVGGAEPAVIAHLDEAGRQPVLQKTANQLFGRQRTGFELVGGRGLVLNGDVALLPREEAVGADGHPNDVRRQRSHGFFPTAHRFPVNAPVRVPDLGLHARDQVGLVPVVSDLGPAQPRQRLDVDQTSVAGGEPSALGRESPSRHDGGHVRMVAQVAGPGGQDANQADPAANAPWVPRQFLQGLRCAPQQEVREHLLGREAPPYPD